MPDGTAKTRPSAWSVGLIVGLALAVCEVGAVGALYRDLPIHGMARFLLVYLTCYAAMLALLGGAAGWLAALLWRRRAAAIALGLAAAWYAVMAYRGYWITRVCSWTDEPDLPLRWVFVGAALPAATALVVAYLLARSRVGRIRFAPLVIGGLGFVGLVAFVTRPEATLPAVPNSALQAPSRARIDSPIDPDSTNILLISIDTMRADHTSPYGYARDTSPNLAALAGRGVLFERCVPQRTNTSPSVASLFTGTYPPTTRVFDCTTALQDFNLTLAEILAEQGYITAAVNTNPAVGPAFNFDQGFSHFEMTAFNIPQDELEESRMVNRAVARWLEANRSQRFFLWVHYKDPHTPSLVPEPYMNIYADDALADAHNHRQIPIGSTPQGTMMRTSVIDGSQDLDFYIAQYDAEIRFIDDSLGELFDLIDHWGLWQNTLVILTSDHGEGLGEHEYYFAHGDHCYQATSWVPLVFAHPALPSGVRVATPVSLVDVVPTLRDLLSLPPDPLLQGQSFAPALLGEPDFSMRPYHYIIGSFRNGYQSHAVTTDRFKLVHDVDERWIYFDVAVEALARAWLGQAMASKYRCRVIRRELYDLAQDPTETVNLAGRGLPIEAELDASLWDWQEVVYRAGQSRSVATGELTPEVVEQLRALGYIVE